MSSGGSIDGSSEGNQELLLMIRTPAGHIKETASEIWKNFPLDLFDNVFAHCGLSTLRKCRLLSKSLSDLAAKYLFAIASCCGTALYDDEPYEDSIVRSRFFKHVQYLYCYGGTDCLRAWESGHPLSKHINNFVLGGSVDTGFWAYFHIQRSSQGATRSVYTRGETLPWPDMWNALRAVYGRSGQLQWKWLTTHSVWEEDLWNVLEGVAATHARFNVDGVHPFSHLERIDLLSEWTISDMIKAFEGKKAVFPQVLPHLKNLRLGDAYQKEKFPLKRLWWLSHPSRLQRMDDADRNRTRDLRNLMSSLPGLEKLNLYGYTPFWWPMLTWSTDPQFPTLLRGPLQVLKISVDVSYLEQAGKWWRSEVYRDDMGPDGSGTLKHLNIYFRKEQSGDPFDPKLLLEWLERVIPRECRVHFQDGGSNDPFRKHIIELQEAFDKAFPRGWRLVGPSATATSSDAV